MAKVNPMPKTTNELTQLATSTGFPPDFKQFGVGYVYFDMIFPIWVEELEIKIGLNSTWIRSK